jgi:hypothetical protein
LILLRGFVFGVVHESVLGEHAVGDGLAEEDREQRIEIED